jgi:hypothetical protein
LGGVAGGSLPALGLGFGGIEFAAAAALLLLAEAAAPRQCLSLSSSSLSLWVLSPVCVFGSLFVVALLCPTFAFLVFSLSPSRLPRQTSFSPRVEWERYQYAAVFFLN